MESDKESTETTFAAAVADSIAPPGTTASDADVRRADRGRVYPAFRGYAAAERATDGEDCNLNDEPSRAMPEAITPAPVMREPRVLTPVPVPQPLATALQGCC